MFNQYTLANHPDLNPVLVAFLAEEGFDSFQETDEGLLAFGEAKRHAKWKKALDRLAAQFSFTYTWEELEEKNWNEAWESEFHPIHIGKQLLIRAEFHEPEEGFEQELVITPKMAFGTGHHATTHMMCELLFERGDLTGQRVFDYGSGTGILAMLAGRLGATFVEAVDIEAPAAESTAENAERNGVTLDRVVHGTLDDVPVSKPYDLILANINRNVILATAGALYERLAPGGTVFFSGILAQDEQLLIERLHLTGLRHQATRARQDWRAFVFSRD